MLTERTVTTGDACEAMRELNYCAKTACSDERAALYALKRDFLRVLCRREPYRAWRDGQLVCFSFRIAEPPYLYHLKASVVTWRVRLSDAPPTVVCRKPIGRVATAMERRVLVATVVRWMQP
jgi:hypothetical protein